MSETISPFLAPRISVERQAASLGAAADLARGLELLGEAKAGRQGALLRLYRPEPTVAFGQRDAHLPGFAAASQAAAAHGFEPLVRKAGGRAAAYHHGCLILDHIQPQPDAMVQAKGRFGFFGELLAAALAGVGVDAAVGEIPGEYCPGEYSVHGTGAGTRVKLVGTAQRVVSGAWLFSSVVVVEDSAPLRAVLTDCYAALGLDWDPATAGAADDLVPGVTVDAVERAVLDAYAPYADLVE
ncbi:lipoate--protein ligase family protein [Pseudarthrobacter sp. P1]|uniref:lipoate--protein ligase family protein n=1 Tax=Pseudarthrobacter sp. P1 TaxID=3418418 RepID=UPI003CF87E0D